MTVKATATATKRYQVHVEGLQAGPVFFQVIDHDEGEALVTALCEAFDIFVHEAGGCASDCPCRQKEVDR